MEASESSDDRRAQQGSALGLFPLAVIMFTFFVPSVRGCMHAESAFTFLTEAPGTAPFVLVPYLAAALACVATAMAVRASSIASRNLRWLLYTGLFLLFAGDVAAIVAFTVDRSDPRFFLIWCSFAMVAGLLLVIRGTRATAFWRWILLLGAFAAFLAGHPVTVLFLNAWYANPDDLLGGGYLFLGAWIVLVAIVCWTLAGAPRRGAA